MGQFLNTLRQIWNGDGRQPVVGYLHHLRWQARRLLGQFPVDLVISRSVLHVDKPRGVAALVNAMGKYDYNNMSFLLEFLTRFGGTLVDVGANIGTYTLVASEAPAARVISIEPHPDTFALLQENVRRNGRRNVACFNIAASDHDGTVRLTDLAGSSVNRVVDANQGSLPSITVSCRTVASLCSELEIVPDLVKIDVEGHETAVLAGLRGVATRCKAILVEGGSERTSIREWMEGSGFMGPLFVHFKTLVLTPRPRPRAEDPLFIRGSLLPMLREMNFTLAGTTEQPNA